MNKFQCKRCGACCKPGWLVDKTAGRPHTVLEKIKSFITRKPLPSRVTYVTWTQWLTEDIERAAPFLGISFDDFVDTYELSDDIDNLAKMKGITKQQLLESEAQKSNMTVDELVKSDTKYRNYSLFTAIRGQERDCPFGKNVEGIHVCTVYPVRPKMCKDYPSQKQLQERFDFYAQHCPGFEKE